LQASSINLLIALYRFVILLFSVSVHGCAQAWMASRLGDHTARMEGRVSLNPARHIDVIGTLIYPGLMIFGPLIGFTLFGGGGLVMGWGKPTPIITRNLSKITRDDNLITIAGTIGYLLLAIVGFLLLVLLILAIPGGFDAVRSILQGQILIDGASAPQALALLGWLTIEVNLALFFFNFLPIPPLDGSRVLRNMLPYNALSSYDQLARFGAILIFILGGFVVNLFMGPAINVVIDILALFFRGHP
jgi:Zn-dependent protease